MMEQKKILSLLNDIKSHPDKTLFDHLKNVGEKSKEILGTKKLGIDEFIDFRTLKNISFLIGITHDFGKATEFFQRYINEKDGLERRKLKNRDETHHAFLSALFAYYVVKEELSKKGLIEKKYYEYLPLIAFLVVKRHHGDLDNVDDELYDFDEEKLEVVEKQINAIEFDRLSIIYKNLSHNINVDDFGKQYKDIFREIKTKQKRKIRQLKKGGGLFYYFITVLLYSILLDADKTDAANLETVKRKNIPSDVVDNYKNLKFGKPKNKINEVREKIYNEVISKVDKLNLDNDKILSLNVPTGTGKTLTSLSFALKLRERLKKKRGYFPRIIYSLPFLSVIDQNYDVFDDVLDHPTTDTLLKHHHLSDITYTRENEFENIENEKEICKTLLLIEGWNSEIIVTTFIQFFHSFISNRNRAIRKFHNITNSIVILDEVQAIPHKYWLLLKETMRFFANYFNTYFIFVTATQPLIFDEEKNEIKPLVEDKDEYFKVFDRIDLIPKIEPIGIEYFKKELKEGINQNPKKDLLIVMNTIDSSKDIYNFIKGEVNANGEDVKIYYLSTNIIPKERLKRIKKIKSEAKQRKIIVSTQLIEAGVDIDVNVVYRDFAPLDSINQVAGRCNRNFRDDKGIVKLFILIDEKNNKKYYEYVYGSFTTEKTRKVFEEELKIKDTISETKFLELNKSYFEEVRGGMSNDESNRLLGYIKKLKFAELSKFKLIESDMDKADVFVEINDEAEEVWKKYKEIINNKELKGFKKNEFLKIKRRFYDYVISVDKRKINPAILENENIGYIPKEDIEKYYDKETGFKRDSESSPWII